MAFIAFHIKPTFMVFTPTTYILTHAVCMFFLHSTKCSFGCLFFFCSPASSVRFLNFSSLSTSSISCLSMNPTAAAAATTSIPRLNRFFRFSFTFHFLFAHSLASLVYTIRLDNKYIKRNVLSGRCVFAWRFASSAEGILFCFFFLLRVCVCRLTPDPGLCIHFSSHSLVTMYPFQSFFFLNRRTIFFCFFFRFSWCCDSIIFYSLYSFRLFSSSLFFFLSLVVFFCVLLCKDVDMAAVRISWENKL